MAEGNNHAKVEGSIAGQSFSVQTRDLIPVLLLLAGGVCGYLVYVAFDQRLLQMREVQVHILQTLQHNREASRQEYNGMHDLHNTQMDYFRKLLTTLDYNIHQEAPDRYPLELVPPPILPPAPAP